MNQMISAEAASALLPTYARYPLTLVKGEGSWLWDDQQAIPGLHERYCRY